MGLERAFTVNAVIDARCETPVVLYDHAKVRFVFT